MSVRHCTIGDDAKRPTNFPASRSVRKLPKTMIVHELLNRRRLLLTFSVLCCCLLCSSSQCSLVAERELRALQQAAVQTFMSTLKDAARQVESELAESASKPSLAVSEILKLANRGVSETARNAATASGDAHASHGSSSSSFDSGRDAHLVSSSVHRRSRSRSRSRERYRGGSGDRTRESAASGGPAHGGSGGSGSYSRPPYSSHSGIPADVADRSRDRPHEGDRKSYPDSSYSGRDRGYDSSRASSSHYRDSDRRASDRDRPGQRVSEGLGCSSAAAPASGRYTGSSGGGSSAYGSSSHGSGYHGHSSQSYRR